MHSELVPACGGCGGYITVQPTIVILAHALVSKCALSSSSQRPCYSPLLHWHCPLPTFQILPADHHGVKPGMPSLSTRLPSPSSPPPPFPSQQTLSLPTCSQLHCLISASILPYLCRNKFQPAQDDCDWQDSPTTVNGDFESC